jgi:hypothetical protein
MIQKKITKSMKAIRFKPKVGNMERETAIYHKSNTHETGECETKKKFDLNKSNRNTQEANAITPLLDNFYHEILASFLTPTNHDGFGVHFVADSHNSDGLLPTARSPFNLNEEYSMIAMQKEVATDRTVTSPSSTLLPTTVAPREVNLKLSLIFEKQRDLYDRGLENVLVNN